MWAVCAACVTAFAVQAPAWTFERFVTSNSGDGTIEGDTAFSSSTATVQEDGTTTVKMMTRGNDIWFHTQKIPGSHVIVVTEGREVPNRTLEQACILAATHSQAVESAKVPVDYTQVRYVKKPNGAKPGMVIYTTNKTAYVTPEEARVLQIQKA